MADLSVSRPWEEVLDAQVRIANLARQGDLGMPRDLRDPEDPGAAMEVSQAVGEALLEAEPVYVDPAVFEAWRFAEASFEPERLDPADPFTAVGFVLLPEPLGLLTEDPKFKSRALFWRQFEDSIAIHGFSCRADWHHDDLAGVDERKLADWAMTAMALYPFSTDPRDQDAKPRRLWRLLQSFWRIAAQVVQSSERPARPVRRRAARAGLVKDDAVTVIRLRRRTRSHEHAEHDVDWSCRWIVRGHWRRLEEGRQTYVRPHLKGPEGKPLRVTERVWEFVR